MANSGKHADEQGARTPRNGVSLAVKLNLIVAISIILVSASLLLITFKRYAGHVETVYKQRVESASKVCAYLAEPNGLRLIWDQMQTDEFQRVRQQAIERNDETLVIDWMKGIKVNYADLHGVDSTESMGPGMQTYGTLYDVYQDYALTAEYIQEGADITSVYYQFMRDGVTYNLIDPEYGPIAMGSIEEPLGAFAEYADNERVPPTVYHGKYGWLCTACMPILDESTNEPVAMFCLDADMNESVDELWAFMRFVIVLGILMTAVVLAVSLNLIRRYATKPLRQLTDATCDSYGNVEGEAPATPIELDIQSNDEIGELYREIRSMQIRIEDHVQNLARVTAEKERAKTELRMASAIQQSMLPSAFPDRTEFSIFASMHAAKDVGGDFYDFFLVDDEHLALVIADVSGKGVPAALFMMMVKIMISNRAQLGGTPAQILSAVNAQICEHNKTKTFVTVWMGILDLSSGELTCSNAGHPYPWIRGGDGVFAMLRDKHSLVVGGTKKTKYTDYTLHLNPGEAIFVHTDGVNEAANPAHELFGYDRLAAALNSRADADPEEVLHVVRACVDEFVDGAEQFDDLTMLCLVFHGKEPASCDERPAFSEITLEAQLESVQQAIDFVAGELDTSPCDSNARYQLLTAVDEIASNVARYAYAPGTGNMTIRFALLEDRSVAEVTFVDWGVAYNPLEADEPDVTLGARQRKLGGLGIFVVKKTMDEMEYERIDDMNVVRIRKRLKS